VTPSKDNRINPALTRVSCGIAAGDINTGDYMHSIKFARAGAVARAAMSLPLAAGKLLAKGVYHAPRSVKTMGLGGAGGYYVGRQHGAQVGEEQGQKQTIKNLTDLLQKKQAVLTPPPLQNTDHFGIKMLGDQALGAQMPRMPNLPQMPQVPPAVMPTPDEQDEASQDTPPLKLAHKQATVILPSMGLGAGLGAVTAPAGHRMEGAGRGAAKGTGTGVGATVGAPAGALGALALSLMNPRVGKTLFGPSSRQLGTYLRQLARTGKLTKVLRPGHMKPENKLQLANTLLGGGAAGAAGGGGLGYASTSAMLGKPSWEKKEASVLSVLGGLAGGGLGGLAGGAGGGILGALGGGALGGGPGAGLGLLAGGAAGLGAGAHMGGNIGTSIGAGFSKKKEKPESAEKEEKSEEKSENTDDEDVKKSAAVVLAQLQKNSAAPLPNMAGKLIQGVGAAAAKATNTAPVAAPLPNMAGKLIQGVGAAAAKATNAAPPVVPPRQSYADLFQRNFAARQPNPHTPKSWADLYKR
jgi:hypothetical protein